MSFGPKDPVRGLLSGIVLRLKADMTVNEWLNWEITWQDTCDYDNAKLAHKLKQSPLYKALS